MKIQKRQNIQSFPKVELFGWSVSLRLLKIEHFFFLQSIYNQKNRGHHIPMIDLGKSKKVAFFNALNDGVDQTFGTFFILVLFPLNCVENF